MKILSGNALMTNIVSTCSTLYESFDLTNIDESADDSDSVSKVNEPVETSTKVCLDVTAINVHASNEKGHNFQTPESRFAFRLAFEYSDYYNVVKFSNAYLSDLR